jgi:hypothetical protein
VTGVTIQGTERVTLVRIRPTATALAESVDAAKYFLPEDPDNLLTADPARRSPVTFRSDDVTLAGHLYRPTGLADTERTPAVALCGPISSVKEQTLPHYAERLADAGYTALTFDPRNLGESEGEPRSHYDPISSPPTSPTPSITCLHAPTSTPIALQSSASVWAGATPSQPEPATSASRRS